jgi:CubicO group peptidase (beta-lactamase class C family)
MSTGRRQFLFELSGSLAAISVGTRVRAEDVETFARTRLPALMEVAGVPGVAIALVRGGEVVWSGGVGVKGAGKGSVSADTVFEAASLSKPLMAYVALMLRDKGKLDLDRPLAEYLGTSPVPDDERGVLITPRHVLSHSTGLMNWRQRREDPFRTSFAPGSQFQYSGEGYVLLQRVVERITGMGYAQYMDDAVLRPLGMTRSAFTWTPQIDEALALGHTNRGQPMDARFTDGRKRMYEYGVQKNKPLRSWTFDDSMQALGDLTPPLPQLPNFAYPNAAASLLTTVNDYAIFMRHVMGVGRGPMPSASSRAMIAEPQVKIVGALSWGLGWGLESIGEGKQLLWHWGDNPGFKNYVAVDQGNRWGLVVLTNGNNGLRLCDRVSRVASGVDRAAFVWL